MSQSPDRRIGTVVGGRYRLLGVLGSGGMGVVFRAEHLLLRKELALKLLHTYLRDHPRGDELKQRFLREAQALSLLDQQHPHIAQIVDCGIAEDGTLYMAMELCVGEPLCDVVSRGPLPPARALHIIVQVLRTLVHAHGRGIVHRDLKPDNILLQQLKGREDFVKLLDFGIAKLLHEAELEPVIAAPDEPEVEGVTAGAPAQPLTRAGMIFGTPEYLAPEQAQGRPVDARTDLYAVGVVLWELLVGRRPFQGKTPLEVIGQHVTAEPEPPSLHAPGPLPPELDGLVLRAMEKDPDDRFASAEDFLKAIDVVLGKLGRGVPSGRILTPLLGGLLRAPPAERRESSVSGRRLQLHAGPLLRHLRWTGALLRRPVQRLRGALPALAERLGVRGTAAVVAAVVLLGIVGIGVLARRIGRTPPPPPAATTLPAPLPQVPLEALIDRLERGESCQERRSAALALLARRDPRALPALQKARLRADGKAGPNRCMLDDLDEAIWQLLPSPAPDGGV